MTRLLFIIVLSLVIHSLYSQDNDLISLINQYRLDQGLGLLVAEEKLSETASRYIPELIEEGKLSHRDRRGQRVLDRYRILGGTSVEAGEILGTSTDLSQILNAWKNSPSHNSLILNPKWLRIGFSLVETDEGLVAVVLFSISQIAGISYEKVSESVLIIIDSIDKRELIFSSNITYEKVLSDNNENNHYKVQIPAEELPRLITLSGNIDGQNKLTDFLYIP